MEIRALYSAVKLIITLVEETYHSGQLFGLDTEKHNEQEVGVLIAAKKPDTMSNRIACPDLKNTLWSFWTSSGTVKQYFNERVPVLFLSCTLPVLVRAWE